MRTTRRGADRKLRRWRDTEVSEEEIQEMKKMIENNRRMVQLVDIQKAYPNFSRELAWQVVRPQPHNGHTSCQ